MVVLNENIHEFDYAEKIASSFTAAGVMKIYSEVCKTMDELSQNSNLSNSIVL